MTRFLATEKEDKPAVSTMNAAALCAVGAEKAVSNEFRKMGLEVYEGAYGRVRFRADLPGLYKALMGSRAADRILLECALFEAKDFDALFEGTRSVAWDMYIRRGMGLVVSKIRSNRSILKAETSIQSVVHKAAAAHLCQKWGIRRLPDEGEKAEIRVYVEKDKVSLLLDLCGEALFKRGYRGSGGPAPLRETTAAAIILLSGWKRKFPLYDPFCGSGTITMEAAMYAWDMAPGLSRHFFLERLGLGDRKTEDLIREELLHRIDFSRQINIMGSDADEGAAGLAKANMERIFSFVRSRKKAGENKSIPFPPLFKAIPMENAYAHTERAGFIITNPPYGKRMGDKEASQELYQKMAGLAQRFPGWHLVLITDHPGFESFFGKNSDSCREITNGAIQSYMYQYEKL